MIEDSKQEEKSRSQVKREFREIHKLGVQLVGLSKNQLNALPLSEETLVALLAAKTMTRTALQRQYRYVASLLSTEDIAAVRAALSGKP